jgi:photosynthetic reaction center H subunit
MDGSVSPNCQDDGHAATHRSGGVSPETDDRTARRRPTTNWMNRPREVPMGITLTNHIDLALVALYVFWAFFAGLIYYLHRENKREGYPLVSSRSTAGVTVEGFPFTPKPKTYLLPHGGTVSVPDPSRHDTRQVLAEPAALFPGAPLVPTGNPMLAGVGPGSWAERADEPDLMHDGDPKIVPLRVATDYFPAKEDPDPRGMTVIAGDRGSPGKVVDAWVDKSEFIFRYYEIELDGSGDRVLVPTNFCTIDAKRRHLRINAIFTEHFAAVPRTRKPDQVTFLEEEKIMAYYGAGTLYAEPRRAEPLL